ncbi:hypothetical protein RIF29_33014 [Crotalaria pallida]|uniref:Protein kinase domain-containing protein n=1 Tax=Crotalaria pallida TaxID=3830 RepID=A0AAN9HSR3_CROPI
MIIICAKLENQTPRPVKRRHGSSAFTLREKEEATCSFSDDNLVGKGGFDRVYKGTLRSGEVVATKKMELPAIKVAEGEHKFRVEVDILSRLDHPNLVSLIGYCADGKHRFQISDFELAKLMPEGQEMHVTARVLGTFGYFDPEYPSVRIYAIRINSSTVICSVHMMQSISFSVLNTY